MKHLHLIILYSILLSSFGCNPSNDEQKRLIERAYMLVNNIDSTTIATFIEWEYVKYEKDSFDCWIKSCWDKGLYTEAYHNCRYAIVYRENHDSTTISLSNLDNFKKDFPFDFDLDTSIYFGLIFSRKQNNELDIYTNTRQPEDYSIVKLRSKVAISEVFKKSNPFEKLSKLDSLKTLLGINRTYFRPEVGNYLQFYLTEKDILTYFPTDLKLTPFLKNHWEKVFHKGLKINENWYLRQTDFPDK